MRPGFAFAATSQERPGALLKGKSARLVVTMGMPALLFRTYFRAHGVKYLDRSVLRLAGIKPVRRTLYGMVAARSHRARERWVAGMERMGSKGV